MMDLAELTGGVALEHMSCVLFHTRHGCALSYKSNITYVSVCLGRFCQ